MISVKLQTMKCLQDFIFELIFSKTSPMKSPYMAGDAVKTQGVVFTWPVTGGFQSQFANSAENVSIWTDSWIYV